MAEELRRNALRTRPLHPAIGAEVLDLDLSQPLDDATLEEIKRLWSQHFVLLFRKQALSEEQQIAFTRRFGKLEVYIEADKRSAKHPEIVRISNVDAEGKIRPAQNDIARFFAILTQLWHTDGSYKPVPSLGSALHAIEVPPSGGETCFSNQVAAWEALPEILKQKVAGKYMLHDHDFTRILAPGLPPSPIEQRLAMPASVHPVLRTHADGRKSLYVSSNVAYYVGGMPHEEGKALHKQLIEWCTQPQFVYCHAWEAGDLLMWDNRFTMHKVQPYKSTEHRRVMQRTELSGSEIPV